ncbi:major facilitator superfamily domain-containing protein [Dioszegia hungarica]|uniref:Major facilitator superfamily domain-containing protein n=1 Tax=Dioszegia hungarica TaxID=4972 RepID=A0AA38H4N1_9TREE|nr:major facilitator superfamily domain-containing protein [Dioszegia hungarica]KAI9634043.1 major facilitator superfamily domain-containing protein [Dioszegia hungarica]
MTDSENQRATSGAMRESDTSGASEGAREDTERFTIFLVMFLVGWSDGSQGPLLPLLQEYYKIDYVIVSLIWIAITIGVIIAAVSNIHLADWIGFGLLTPLGALVQSTGYVLMCWGGPYPLFVIAYVFVGLGMGWQDAQVNSLSTRMPHATTITFMLHAAYGLGATVSPFVATPFAQRVTGRFYLYFITSLGLGIGTVITLILTFQGRTEDQIVGKRPDEGLEAVPGVLNSATEPGTTPLDEHKGAVPAEAESKGDIMLPTELGEATGAEARGSSAKYMAILSTPKAYFLCIYIFLYMGVEVAIGGWATTFLIQERGGNSSSGYVTSGFFGGLTVGRIVLIPVTNRLGHRLSVYIYTVIAIGLELIVWLVPSLIGSALCFSLVGVALGPMYPSCVMIITEVMPTDLHTGTIGLMACIGFVGSAIMPFITGAIADRHGVWVLQPLMIALLTVSIGMWFLVARASAHKP